MAITVGFDLDMTLIDPRAGLVAVFDMLADEFGIPLDGAAFVTRLGPPVREEFERYGADEATVSALVERFRALTPSVAIPATVAMPGAMEAVEAVRKRGGRVVVVTGKFQANAAAHLESLGLMVDAVIGDLWSLQKAVAVRREKAAMYVGDHVGDMVAARAADVLAVAVASGWQARQNSCRPAPTLCWQTLLSLPTGLILTWLVGPLDSRSQITGVPPWNPVADGSGRQRSIGSPAIVPCRV